MTTITDAVRYAILGELAGIHTALPGKILAYDFEKQKAQVQPLLKKRYTNGEIQSLPIINNVPVIFPRSGGASLTFPVQVGDTCLLLFIERSTDIWRSVGGEVAPTDPRKFSLSDAVAIMGLFPFTESSLADNNTDVLLTYEGSKFRIKQNGDVVIQTSSKIAIGNQTTEVLDILSRVINILETSVTTAVAAPIQQVPIPPNGDTYTTLKAKINLLKGAIS